MMCTHIMTCTPCPQVEMSNQPIRQMQNTIAEGLRHHQALMIRVEANDFQEYCMGNHVKTLRLQRLDRCATPQRKKKDRKDIYSNW